MTLQYTHGPLTFYTLSRRTIHLPGPVPLRRVNMQRLPDDSQRFYCDVQAGDGWLPGYTETDPRTPYKVGDSVTLRLPVPGTQWDSFTDGTGIIASDPEERRQATKGTNNFGHWVTYLQGQKTQQGFYFLSQLRPANTPPTKTITLTDEQVETIDLALYALWEQCTDDPTMAERVKALRKFLKGD